MGADPEASPMRLGRDVAVPQVSSLECPFPECHPFTRDFLGNFRRRLRLDEGSVSVSRSEAGGWG